MRGPLLTALTIGLLAAGGTSAQAQLAAEIRVASSEYRYLDVNYTFAGGIMIDTLYIGVPGQNEVYLGAGYTFNPASWLSLIPIGYGVVGKENDERGLVLGGYVWLERGPYTAIAFLGRFIHLRGGVASYDFLDTLDVTRSIAGPWEAGFSSTVYREGEDWSHLVGPMLKRRDDKGWWALSALWGYEDEVRLVRVLTF
jgi:hypothetical protein